VGLFLLGMSMMTDGREQAAGLELQRTLRGATRTRWHARGSGLLVVSSLALDALEREVARLAHVATAQADFDRALDTLFALSDPNVSRGRATSRSTAWVVRWNRLMKRC
jgi:hypothetical protein